VSPDGRRLAYISSRDAEDDVDVWVATLPRDANGKVQRTRVTQTRGREGFPAWAPGSDRLAYFAVREGAGSVWVASVDSPEPGAPRIRPQPAPVLVSRRGGVPAWSPDGRRIAIAELPPPDPTYNGNPLRSADEPPPLFAVDAFRLWTVDAPLPLSMPARARWPGPGRARAASRGVRPRVGVAAAPVLRGRPGAAAWAALRDRLRPEAQAARTEAALESVVDRLIAGQPLIKPDW
jgi:hypothetical protein